MSTISEIENAAEAQGIAARLAESLARAPNGQFRLRRRDGWIGVPVEGSCHLNNEDQVRLAQQYLLNEHEEVFAVRLEELDGEPLVYRVRATADGIGAFNRRCSHHNYCLCPPDMSSLVICSTDDFFVVAGQRQFVTSAIGTTQVRGYEAFRAYGARIGEIWPRMPGFVERIYLALAEDYPKAALGAWVEFPRAEPALCDAELNSEGA